jgi:hypothetical protein
MDGPLKWVYGMQEGQKNPHPQNNNLFQSEGLPTINVC